VSFVTNTNWQAYSGEVSLGNFWVDATRSVIYVLLPLALVVAIVLAGQGVVQSFRDYVPALTLQGKTDLVPMGPAASQVAIKQLGTNGGGFFGANSAHPFENPTPLSNIVELISLLLIPASFPFLFGRMAGKRRQGGSSSS
jgi:K+-transporting ATPase ATPase A chain